MADPFADFIDIRADLLTDVGHLIDEADLGRKHAVCRILDHLRTLDTDSDERLFGAKEWLVNFLQDVSSGWAT